MVCNKKGSILIFMIQNTYTAQHEKPSQLQSVARLL